jgi:hypothetical protein
MNAICNLPFICSSARTGLKHIWLDLWRFLMGGRDEHPASAFKKKEKNREQTEKTTERIPVDIPENKSYACGGGN